MSAEHDTTHVLPTQQFKKDAMFVFRDLSKPETSRLEIEIDSTCNVSSPVTQEILEVFRLANASWFGRPANLDAEIIPAAVTEARLSCDLLINFPGRIKPKHQVSHVYAVGSIIFRRCPMLCEKVLTARRNYNDQARVGNNCHFTILDCTESTPKANNRFHSA